MEKVPLFRVNQWLNSWLPVNKQGLGAVPHHFYLASISLLKLRQLAGVHQRDKDSRKIRSKGAGYQRALDQSRTKEISRFVEYGYPLSSDTSLKPQDYSDLVHPGWLPTAILVNVLTENDVRYRGNRELKVPKDKLLTIKKDNGQEFLEIPDEPYGLTAENDNSAVDRLQPIEIIDGQHRVFSVDKINDFPTDYQVPVVIFQGLSESWQAYLFWVINVEPKRINTSLAFDLYPELRSQSWLERGENIKIYQEHRAQELTEIMWRHENSIWKDRIELLGTRVPGHVSNASFIRSLTSSFVRKWTKPEKVGGLFGSIDEKRKIIPWKRAQQAAFLMFCWRILSQQISYADVPWVEVFKKITTDQTLPEALINAKSLLSTDQGVRTIHYIFNIFCVRNYRALNLSDWYMPNIPDIPENDSISEALEELDKNEILKHYLEDLAKALVINLDWRTSDAPGLSEDEKQKQSAYRGSAGYSLLRRRAIEALTKSSNSKIASIAKDLNDK